MKRASSRSALNYFLIFLIEAFGCFSESANIAGILVRKSCASPLVHAQESLPQTVKEVGLLVEVESGMQILGFNSYIGSGHSALADMINKRHGKIRKFLWGGEVELRLKGPFWEIIRANETSGYLHDSEWGRTNDVTNLKTFLNLYVPASIGGHFSGQRFDRNNPHLDPNIESFSRGGNFRHDIIDIASTYETANLSLLHFLKANDLEDYLTTLQGVTSEFGQNFFVSMGDFVNRVANMAGPHRFKTFRASDLTTRTPHLVLASGTPIKPDPLISLLQESAQLYSKFLEELKEIVYDQNVSSVAEAVIVIPKR